MRLDDGVCWGGSAVEQSPCQGRLLAPLLFHIFFVAAINVD